MTSQLEQDVIAIQVNNYLSLAIVTVVGYDYILTFSSEIEYIWKKPLCWISTLFVIARYSGLCYAILSAIIGSSFVPGPVKRPIPQRCELGVFFFWWSYWIFLCAADMVMILRVWALYKQSKLVLGTLLVLYAMEIISLVTRYIIDSILLDSGYAGVVGPVQVLQFSFCIPPDYSHPIWLADFPFAVAIVLGALMCLLTAIRFVKELHQVYKMTRCFHLNHYMKYLLRDGMVYFIAVLLFSLFTLLANNGIQTVDGWLSLVAAWFEQVPPVILVPRFILGLRELYVEEIRANNTDSAFGFGSGFGRSETQARSVLHFADASEEDENEEQGEEIQMEERVKNVHHVDSLP